MRMPRVSDYMDTVVHTLRPDTPILDAVGFLLDKQVTGAPVVDAQNKVVGIISEKDCLKLLAMGDDNELPTGVVSDYMTREVRSVPARMNVYFVAGMFLNDFVRRFPVVEEDNTLVGAITRFDILRGIREHLGKAG